MLALTALLLIAGCATSPPPGTEPRNDGSSRADDSSAAVTAPEQTADDESAPTRPSRDEATLALLNQSDRAVANGAIDDALAYAERAVRIDPRRADLWTRLARLELANEDPDTAIRYAHKALALAGTRVDWTRDAWLVIAEAKDALGASEEAAAIRQRWATARG
jgi:tetratricopeptide (TPR) repeat protein